MDITGLPLELTAFLRDKLDVKTFIETGTGLGRTARIASDMFERVYTIEADNGRWLYNQQQFIGTNVNCILGESPQALKHLLDRLNEISSINSIYKKRNK